MAVMGRWVHGVGDSGLEGPATVTPDEAVDQEPRSHRWRSPLVLAALIIAAVSLNVLHIARYDTVGPIDELQHLDAAIRAPQGDFIGSGEKFSQEALRIEACRGIDSPGFVVPHCPKRASTHLKPESFQEGGFNTAYIHPPTFYLVDGSIGRVVKATLPGNHDYLTSIRLAGLVWVVAGVVMLWLLLEEAGAGLAARAALIGVTIGSLAVLEATATINVDATAIAIGAGVLWGVLRWQRRAGSAVWPIVFAVLAAATKVTNILAVGVAILFLVAVACGATDGGGEPLSQTSLADRLRSHRREITLIVALAVAVLVPSILWMFGQRALQELPPSVIPMNRRFKVTEFPWHAFTTSWKVAFSPLASPNIIPKLDQAWTYVWLGLTDLLLVAIAVLGTVVAPARSRIRVLGVVTLITAAILGPAVVLFNAVVQGTYVSIPPRYGLALVPAMLVLGVPLVRRRAALVAVAVVAAGSTLTLFLGLL